MECMVWDPSGLEAAAYTDARPGTAEWYTAEGMAAHDAGAEIRDCPYLNSPGSVYDWKVGWNARRMQMTIEYRDYVKARSLFDRKYGPPGATRGDLERFQSYRLKTINRLEAAWPRFREVYEKRN